MSEQIGRRVKMPNGMKGEVVEEVSRSWEQFFFYRIRWDCHGTSVVSEMFLAAFCCGDTR